MKLYVHNNNEVRFLFSIYILYYSLLIDSCNQSNSRATAVCTIYNNQIKVLRFFDIFTF